jgi:hypothetical protein
MRRVSAKPLCAPAAESLASAEAAAHAAFPGTAATLAIEDGKPLIYTTGRPTSGSLGFRQEQLEENMMALYRNHDPINQKALPIRLGRVLRVSRENARDHFAILESWWPLLKESKYGRKLNAFGTWVASPHPTNMPSGQTKRQRTSYAQNLPSSSAAIGDTAQMVSLTDVLVWPIQLDKGGLSDIGGRIPLSVFHYVRAHHGIDMSVPAYTFAARGQSFRDEVLKIAAGLAPALE